MVNKNTFFIVDIPVVNVLSNQYSVNIGSSVTLECTVVASPTHTTVYWERNVNGVSTRITTGTGKYTGSTVSNPSLTVNNADNSDEGFYICFATNSVGTGQSSNTYLDVLGSKLKSQFMSYAYIFLNIVLTIFFSNTYELLIFFVGPGCSSVLGS